jgi:hypothetical protein
MKKVLVVAILAAGVYFGWGYFFAPPPEASPVARLSQFIDAHVDEILGPLPFEMQGQIPSPAQNHQLRVLREGIRDRQRDAARDEKRLYESAALLCDDLLRAGEERSRHIGRINDTRAKWLAFFENGIALSWQGASRKLRAVIDQRYRQVRELERNLSEQ